MRFSRLAFSLALPAALGILPIAAAACTSTYTVILQNQGSGAASNVLVELRQGAPGHSVLLSSQRSIGGTATFTGLCAGSYFLAIGDGDSVQVTPVHDFLDSHIYKSTITLVTGPGNVSTQSRQSL
jgi:hypothetical protein